MSLLTALSGCDSSTEPESRYPRRPIKLIVPFGAGGGSDVFARLIQDAITKHQLLPEPLVIVNVPGAGGTVGSRRVMHARPDGYTLLLLHEGMFTAHHSGQANYGAEAFTAIAGTTNATQVIAVSADSPHRDLLSLMAASKSRPDSIVFSANLGAPSHFAGLMLEHESPGSKFRYTQTGGGAKRFAALQGGHVDVSAFSIAEYVQFRQSGLRALALLGESRHEKLPELATAREQGFDVISQNMQFWWAPPGTPEDRVQRIAEAVSQAVATTDVQRKLAEMNVGGEVLVGDALKAEIRSRDERLAAVAPRSTAPLPNLANFAIIAVLLTGGLAALQASRRKLAGPVPTATEPRPPAAAGARTRVITVLVATPLYVIVLQRDWLNFPVATSLFVAVLGSVLARADDDVMNSHRFRRSVAVLITALCAGFLLHHLFANLLVVDLP